MCYVMINQTFSKFTRALSFYEISTSVKQNVTIKKVSQNI